MKNLRKMTKLKSEKMRTALRVVALVLLVGANFGVLMAQTQPKGMVGKNSRDEETPQFQLNKEVGETGTLLTLESYATGEASLKPKPVDLTLLLDVSGSMTIDDKIPASKVGVFTEFSYYKAIRATVSYKYPIDQADGFLPPYYFKIDDNYFEVKAFKTGGTSSTSQGNAWLYFDTNDGKRYYLKGTDVIEARDKTTPTDSNFPVAADGSTIQPVYGKHNNSDSAPTIWEGQLYNNLSFVKKMTALKSALFEFVDVILQKSIEDGVEHRLSIVQFSNNSKPSGSTIAEHDPQQYYSGHAENYTMVLKNFTVVNKDNAVTLKRVLSRMYSQGQTYSNMGMDLTKDILNLNPPLTNPSYDNSKSHVLVMFTDGQSDAAKETIENAKPIKDSNVPIYTVGIFKASEYTEDVRKYMNYVSSNYPNATSLTNPGTQASDKYYFKVENSGDLAAIFKAIAEESTTKSTEAGPATIVQDVISEYFELPAGTGVSNIGVYTANCTGADDLGKLQFGERESFPSATIEIKDGNKIRVSGFDFTNNWCGYNWILGQYQGKKLIINIPIERKPGTQPGIHETNAEGSTILPNGEEDPTVDPFVSPKYYIKGETWVSHTNENPGEDDIKLVGDTYEIYTNEGLAWFISIVSGYNGQPGNPAANGKLMDDVDMSEYIWVPIGGNGYCEISSLSGWVYTYPAKHGFSGTFDGQGHVIRGLNNADPVSIPQVGLFGNVTGTVKNTFVVGCNFKAAVGKTAADNLCTGTEGHFGIIADTLSGNGTISNCEAEGILMTFDTIGKMYDDENYAVAAPQQDPTKCHLGGLVGLVQGSAKVHSCMSVANIAGYDMAGIVNEMKDNGTALQNCYAYTTHHVFTTETCTRYLGGLVAKNAGTVENCYLRERASVTKDGIAFTGIKANVTSGTDYRLFAQNNTGTVTNIYIPQDWNTLTDKFVAGTAAQNVGSFTPAVTPYLYQHKDTQVTMLPNTQGGRLLQTLNAWANANGCTPWMRTTANGINNDYPVLKIAGLQSVASDDQIVLFYGDVNEMMSSRVLMVEGKNNDVICLYENAALTSGNNGTTLYINEDVAVTQTDGLVNTAYVGITLDNSAGESGANSNEHGFGNDAIDWHMFATSLSDAPVGIDYDDDETPWPFSYDHPTGMPYYSFYGEDQYDGYFPSTDFDGNDYYQDWDFYFWDEYSQHYINFKRNFYSHWSEGHDVNHTALHLNITCNDEKQVRLTRGRGYMLAVADPEGTFLQSHGTLNNGSFEKPVTYNGNLDDFCPGYNLIGNPYQSYLDFEAFASGNSGINGYVIIDEDEDELGYYVQYPTGGTVDPELQFINMHQGFFIQVNANQNLVFDNSMRSLTPNAGTHFRGEEKATYPYLRLFVKETSGYGDYTTIEFNRPELGGGEKFMGLRAGNAQIYVHNGETNYSTLFATSDFSEVPVRFNTLEDGTFTLTWKFSEGDFNEMYLIDNIAGQKIDMLTHDNYKFEGHAADFASRFNVVFAIDGDNNGDSNSETDVEPVESFAFQMDGNLIVNGMGTCQVFDLTGRLVSTNQLTDTQNTVALPQTAGIYMVRLVNGSSVKVQKIVVE